MQLRTTPSEGEFKEKLRVNLITTRRNATGRKSSSANDD
jgi:hypothetical protein